MKRIFDMGKTFNAISKNVSKDDIDLFFGKDETDFIIIEDHWIMGHLLHACGIFKSVSQARKNGGNVPISQGFTITTRGKKAKKCSIFTLNKKE